jgi:hypothetical protein
LAVDKKAALQSIIIGLLVAVGLFFSVLLLSNSWIKFFAIGAFLVSGISWLLSRGSLKKALKYLVVAIMIFAISFTSYESYLFWNAGYPPTYSPSEPKTSLSLQGMLNASLTQTLQDIEQSTTFSLLKLEHGDKIMFESMNLMPSNGPGGYISVDFLTENSNAYFHFYSANGHQYILQKTSYAGRLASQLYPSNQTADETFRQIDSLGLSWFYNRALEIAQNRTTNLPSVDSLTLSITYEEHGNYQGITLQLSGFHQTVLEDGSIHGEGIIIADFQPDGTLIYMTQPQANT